MSFSTPQVFISSTSEFAAERKSLAGAIASMKDMDFHPYIYEEEALPGTSAEQQCARRLRESELVLLLVGAAFGTTFPNRDTSIVQWEYEYARKLPVPVHPYLKKVDATAIDPRQKEFIEELTDFSRGTWSRFFTSEQELVEWSVNDLRRWRLDSWQLHQRERGERRRWKDLVVIAAGALVSVGLVASLIAGVLTDVPMEKLAMVLAAGLGALGIVGWLLKKDDL
jgi:hypothetical protein